MTQDADKRTGQDLSDLQCRLAATHTLSVITVVVGVICFAFGIPTLILTASNPMYPFSSGSGTYTGILTVLTGVLGLVLIHRAKTSHASTLRGLNIAYRVFLSLGVDVGAVHFGYGIWSLVVCARGPSVQACGGINWSANYLLAGVNMVIGLSILVVCVVTYIMTWTLLKRLWQLSKVKDTELTSNL